MKSLIFVLVFLPAVLFAAHINWELLNSRDLKRDEYNYNVFPLPDSGITYIFWTDYNSSTEYRALYFQVRLKNGTYTSPHIFTTRFENWGRESSYSVQVSLDGKHILIAYNELRPDKIYNNANDWFHIEIFFSESINGGETWSQPIPVDEGTYNFGKFIRNPSIIFEEDTNRVIIGYVLRALTRDTAKLVVKESGSTKFTPKNINVNAKYIGSIRLAITIDKSNSKRYLHGIWSNFDDYIYYTRSEDDGKTWTPSVSIMKIRDFFGWESVVVNDYNAFGSGIFIQYYYDQEIRLVYTNDHGKLWVSTQVDSDVGGYHSLCVCGYNEKGRLISIIGKTESKNGYIKYQEPYQRSFIKAEYPFGPTSTPVMTNINCRYDRKGKYAVAALLVEEDPRRVHIVYGTMNGN